MTDYRNRIKAYRTVNASEIRRNPMNFRRHPDRQRDALRSLLDSTGVVSPLLVMEDGDGYMLLDGELRWSEGGSWPVAILDIDQDEAMTVLAMLDKIGADAEIDPTALMALLDSLPAQARQTARVAWTDEDVARLLEDARALPEAGAGGDEFDPTPEEGETRTALGELWIIGGVHRLLVGDCTVKENVDRLMRSQEIDLLLSDPPYGIGWDTDYTRFTTEYGTKRTNYPVVENDDKPFDPRPFLDYPQVILWGANWYCQHIPMGSWLIWDKRHPNGTAWLSDAEIGWAKGGKGVYIYSETVQGAHRAERAQHPTQKPTGLMTWCIERAKDVQSIYDPFLGSGTTLIAAHRTGRRCYGMEIAPRYADVILRRAEAEGLTVERASD